MKVRLIRALALSGVTSRRKAEGLIRKGSVRVNGEKVIHPATEIYLGRDEIKVLGKRVEAEQRIYYLLYKPKGAVSTVSDPLKRKTVMAYAPNRRERLYPVGRLDKDTTGALLLTNDGELANCLMHPRYQVERWYHARVKGQPTVRALERLRKGLHFGRKFSRAFHVKVRKQTHDYTDIDLVLKEGWKHEVKILLATVGYPVLELERTRFAGLTLAGLRKGESRRLTKQEVDLLRRTYCKEV